LSNPDPELVSMDGTGLSLAVRSDMFESSNQSTDPIEVEGNSSGADGDSASASQSCIVFVML
jgi:predicted ATP-dependent protease